nr:uncharacterized protein LOC115256080 [Aedes albopictus]XP_029735449.1 uncharacterized protein LOC115270282 [Aedes albopictus]
MANLSTGGYVASILKHGASEMRRILRKDYKQLYMAEQQRNKVLQNKLISVNRLLSKIKNEKRILCRKLIQQNKMKKNNKERMMKLKQQLKTKENVAAEDRKLLTAVRENEILKESIHNAGLNKFGRRYNHIRLHATRQKLTSSAGYKCLRKSNIITLPHPKTVTAWQKSVTIEAGFNHEVLNRMAFTGKTMSAEDKVVAILIDGMTINPMLHYNAKSDRFYGFPSAGRQICVDEANDPEVLATEAVTIMIKSIHRNGHKQFKQVIGYFLANSTLGSDLQKEIVCEAVRLVFKSGFTPVLLVMDQHPTNVKMATTLGVTIEKPVFKVDSNEIVVFYDSPHVFKSLRNNFHTKNILLNGEILSFDHVIDLFNEDFGKIPRLVPGLTKKAIELPAFSKMNVKTAVKTFSRTTAKAMLCYVELGKMSESCLPTAEFIEKMDGLFDVFNSKQITDNVKPLNSAITSDSCHWDFLEDVKQTFEEMVFVPKTSFDPSKVSFISCESVIYLDL